MFGKTMIALAFGCMLASSAASQVSGGWRSGDTMGNKQIVFGSFSSHGTNLEMDCPDDIADRRFFGASLRGKTEGITIRFSDGYVAKQTVGERTPENISSFNRIWNEFRTNASVTISGNGAPVVIPLASSRKFFNQPICSNEVDHN